MALEKIQGVRVEPGDVILTGTPSGVGQLPRDAVLGLSLSLGLDVGTRTR